MDPGTPAPPDAQPPKPCRCPECGTERPATRPERTSSALPRWWFILVSAVTLGIVGVGTAMRGLEATQIIGNGWTNWTPLGGGGMDKGIEPLTIGDVRHHADRAHHLIDANELRRIAGGERAGSAELTLRTQDRVEVQLTRTSGCGWPRAWATLYMDRSLVLPELKNTGTTVPSGWIWASTVRQLTVILPSPPGERRMLMVFADYLIVYAACVGLVWWSFRFARARGWRSPRGRWFRRALAAGCAAVVLFPHWTSGQVLDVGPVAMPGAVTPGWGPAREVPLGVNAEELARTADDPDAGARFLDQIATKLPRKSPDGQVVLIGTPIPELRSAVHYAFGWPLDLAWAERSEHTPATEALARRHGLPRVWWNMNDPAVMYTLLDRPFTTLLINVNVFAILSVAQMIAVPALVLRAVVRLFNPAPRRWRRGLCTNCGYPLAIPPAPPA